MIAQVTTTAALVAAVEARIEALDTDIVIVDRLSMWDGAALRRADKAAFVEVTESTDAGGRGSQVVFVEDTVRVVLLFSTNPREQKASQQSALVVEDAIRAGLLERSWSAPLVLRHVRTRRGPAARPALGWYEIAIELRAWRPITAADPVLA